MSSTLSGDIRRLLEREQAWGLRKVYLPEMEGRGQSFLTPEHRQRTLQRTADSLSQCTRCGLSQNRTHPVWGDGDVRCRLMLVGEGPGEEEDRQGLPFVGACGQLLDRMLTAIHLTRGEVYICNVVKCRPPDNRTPVEEEIQACLPHLASQIRLIRPALICALGDVALNALVPGTSGLTQARGKVYAYEGIPVVPTFHPGVLLKNPGEKRLAWEDMKLIARLLGRPVNEGGGAS